MGAKENIFVSSHAKKCEKDGIKCRQHPPSYCIINMYIMRLTINNHFPLCFLTINYISSSNFYYNITNKVIYG